MKHKLSTILVIALFALLIGAGGAAAQTTGLDIPAAPLGTAFIYQGRLSQDGSPADGVYDFRFILYDAGVGGAQVGSTLILDDQAVNQGYFTVMLDFGAGAFNGQARWLEIAVRPGGSSGEYTTLSPRQALTAAPYAFFSQRSPWSGLSGVPVGFADEVDNTWSPHDHLSETWLGSGNPLVITGTYNTAPYSATLVLDNNSNVGNGLIIDGVKRMGVGIPTANTGVWVGDATDVAFQAVKTNRCGLLVSDAARYGVYIASAGETGVYAESTNHSYYGGDFRNSANLGAGLYARGGSNSAADVVLGGNDASYDDGRVYSDPALSGSDILLMSNDAIQLELDNDNDESGDVWIMNGANTTIFSINENGDMTAIGTKSAAVSTQDYGVRKLYAMESPQNWFEDFGSAQLVDGLAVVAIEPVFAQTVNLDETYHVFLTPLGDCPLYVAEKTTQGFTVKAMGGQACSIPFDYRIVAKRLGYEALRLEPATDLEREGEE